MSCNCNIQCQVNICDDTFFVGTTTDTGFDAVLFDMATGARYDLLYEQEEGGLTVDFEGVRKVPGRIYEIVLRDGCNPIEFERNDATYSCIAIEFVSIKAQPSE
jgi:hypothetical protein